MSSAFPAGEPLIGPEPLGETSPGREVPTRSAIVVYGRLNYLLLGTLIAVARGFVNDVYVVMEQEDSRAGSLARSLGAQVIVPDRERTLDVIFASYGTVVIMRGDGTQDPYAIPELLHRIKEGHDAAVVPSAPAAATDESSLVLNNKHPADPAAGLMALTRRAALGLKLKKGESLGRQVADYLKRSGTIPLSVGSGNDSLLFSAYLIGVVVPAFNEEALLGETVRGVPDYVGRIYVIDDGSTDGTPGVIKRLEDPRVVAVRHEVNRGVGASIIDGYKLALRDGMDLVAVMAGDNQMDPAELPRLLLPVIEGRTDYAKGNRLLTRGMRRGMSNWRYLGNSMLTLINKIASGYWQVSDPQNGYTVISRKALETLDLDAVYTYYGYCNDLLVKLNTFGLRAADVPIRARYGQERSKIKYSRFMVRVAPMLFRSFLQRLRVKYTVLDFHPLVLFYATAMLVIPAGLLAGVVSAALMSLAAPVLTPLILIAAIMVLAGLQFLFTAMAFDWEADSLSRAGSPR